MGKQTKKQLKPICDPQDHPISKSKTLQTNLNSYIRMLKKNFPEISSKQYIRYVHRFIGKIKRKLKFLNQKKLIEACSKIKICKECQGWNDNKAMIQCNLCEDNYHLCCLGKTPSKQYKEWCCQICDSINKLKKEDKNIYLEAFVKQDQCQKCQKTKKQYQTFIVCLKCNYKYHRNCYGKSNVVCFKCNHTIEKQIKQKQASLFDYKFQRKTESYKKKNNQTKNSDLKIFGKDQYIDQATQSSTNLYPNFNRNFPAMTYQEQEQYKNSLLYAIRAKQMIHVEQLMPINCEIYDNNEQSLDFGLQHMNPLEYNVYKKYKEQPFGPYNFIYRQNVGYDVIADKDLPKGMLVCEYVGDVVSFREIVKSHGNSNSSHNDSLFELRAGSNADETLYIRPEKYTNMGRFINGVNNKTGMNKINIASIRMLAKGRPGIFLYTARKIKKGESLAYDYNGGELNAYPTEEFV